MWNEDFEKLLNSEKEEFRRLMCYILSKTFLLRDVFDTKENMMKINRDYRFVERNFDLFREYLRYGGWKIEKDNNYGVIAISNQYDYNRINLDKNTTLIIYIIRLIFEEEREKVSLRNEILVTTGQIVHKMITLGLLKRKPSDKELTDSFRTIGSHNIITKLSGSWESPDCRLLVHPSILFVITNERISRIYEMFQGDDEKDSEPDLDSDLNFIEELEEPEKLIRGDEEEL